LINIGNLSGGIIAKKMGLPVTKFIASTNINDIVPQYLDTGVYSPRQSVKTIANAMDVGTPSNFIRLSEFYTNDVTKMRQDIIGRSYTDDEIRVVIKKVYSQFNYILDPHGAVAYLGLTDYLSDNDIKDANGVFLETAHPAKFFEDIESILGKKITMPASLKHAMEQQKLSIKVKNSFAALKEFLLAS